MAASAPVHMNSMLVRVHHVCRRLYSSLSFCEARVKNSSRRTNLNRGLLICASRFLRRIQPLHVKSMQLQLHSFHPPDPTKVCGDEDELTRPEDLISSDLADISRKIINEIATFCPDLKDVATYHFDGLGKRIRPTVVVLMARALNVHLRGPLHTLMPNQRDVAIIAEMLHTATLLHDDVIDNSDTRRGKQSANLIWGSKKAILGGDFLMSRISHILAATIGNNDVTILLSKTIADLVEAEFMQLESKLEASEQFSHYLVKTFKKTASLIAHCCQSVAIIGHADKKVQDIAFQYGKNLGIAYQLIDDVLDFVSNEETLGKPTSADLRLGLATAPVFFAREKYPELIPLITRRFSESGDVEKAYEAVLKSDGVKCTRLLAQKHCLDAIQCIHQIAPSPEQKALITLTDRVINRVK